MLAAARSEWCEAHHKEMQPRKWDQIHCQFSQICANLVCLRTDHARVSHHHSARSKLTICSNGTRLPCRAAKSTDLPLHRSSGLESKQRYAMKSGLEPIVAESAPELSWPGKRRQQVMPDMTAEIRWFRSPKVGVVSFRVRKQMSYNASLSRTCRIRQQK